jgi:hypothetical protein
MKTTGREVRISEALPSSSDQTRDVDSARAPAKPLGLPRLQGQAPVVQTIDRFLSPGDREALFQAQKGPTARLLSLKEQGKFRQRAGEVRGSLYDKQTKKISIKNIEKQWPFIKVALEEGQPPGWGRWALNGLIHFASAIGIGSLSSTVHAAKENLDANNRFQAMRGDILGLLKTREFVKSAIASDHPELLQLGLNEFIDQLPYGAHSESDGMTLTGSGNRLLSLIGQLILNKKPAALTALFGAIEKAKNSKGACFLKQAEEHVAFHRQCVIQVNGGLIERLAKLRV